MKYNLYTLGDLVTIKYGKNQKKVLSENGTVPIYGTGGLMGYATEALYNKPSVLIGRKGTIEKIRYVEHPFWTVDTLFYTIVNESIVIPRFLYYLLLQVDFKQYNEGTTIQSLRTETLKRIELEIPVIEEQRIILDYLSKLDDKIALNTKINENLEQQAQAIFKSWFIDFEPFGGVMPDDWQVTTLGNIAKISTKSINPLKQPELYLEHYSIPAYDEQHYPIFEYASEIKSNKYILTKDSVMISKLNPNTKRIWRPLCLSDKPVCSTEFIVYEAVNSKHKDYIYSLIDSQEFSDFLCAHTTGSTNSRQRATPKTTLDFSCVLPTEDIISQFCGIVTPIYDRIGTNLIENQRLAGLRDTLLPKLMNGEIDVSQVQNKFR